MKAIEEMRKEIRRLNYSYKTEKAYISWCMRLIGYHDNAMPGDICKADIVEYLNYLANEQHVSGSTQNQALCAIVFLFKRVLGLDLSGLEIWRDIEGYEDNYQVSNKGRVTSKDHFTSRKNRNGEIDKLFFKGKILSQADNSNGYLRVFLSKKGEVKTHYVHTLVAENFLGNCQELKEVNHIDGDKKNNEINNLEYVTRKENVEHAWNKGLCKHKGQKHYKTSLSKKDVRAIRSLYKTERFTQKQISKMFRISRISINDIVNRRRWKHI